MQSGASMVIDGRTLVIEKQDLTQIGANFDNDNVDFSNIYTSENTDDECDILNSPTESLDGTNTSPKYGVKKQTAVVVNDTLIYIIGGICYSFDSYKNTSDFNYKETVLKMVLIYDISSKTLYYNKTNDLGQARSYGTALYQMMVNIFIIWWIGRK